MIRNIYFVFIILLLFPITGGPAVYAGDIDERLENASDVLEEIMRAPDKGIPEDILEKCHAIVVIPHVVKAGLIFGGKYGKGVLSARNEQSGQWSAPAFCTIAGGSWGLQIGAEAIDLILVVMNEKGLKTLLKNKVKLGGDIGVAAGPVGRRAEAGTDLYLKAEILSYSRSKGFFAGISLEGASLTEDKDANRAYYGEKLSTKDIIFKHKVLNAPGEAKKFMHTLGVVTSGHRD